MAKAKLLAIVAIVGGGLAWAKYRASGEAAFGSVQTIEEQANVNTDAANETAESPDVRVERSDAEWKKLLTPKQYHVAREKGTEAAFSGELWNNHEQGTYRCVCCGAPLFGSDTKFESGTGWPSFFRPIGDEIIAEHEDNGWLMRRIEVTCSRCDAHLGHVFDDGPQPTGLRYCINSAALKFDEREKPQQPAAP